MNIPTHVFVALGFHKNVKLIQNNKSKLVYLNGENGTQSQKWIFEWSNHEEMNKECTTNLIKSSL